MCRRLSATCDWCERMHRVDGARWGHFSAMLGLLGDGPRCARYGVLESMPLDCAWFAWFLAEWGICTSCSSMLVLDAMKWSLLLVNCRKRGECARDAEGARVTLPRHAEDASLGVICRRRSLLRAELIGQICAVCILPRLMITRSSYAKQNLHNPRSSTS